MRVSLRGGHNELVEEAEAEDESCLRSGFYPVSRMLLVGHDHLYHKNTRWFQGLCKHTPWFKQGVLNVYLTTFFVEAMSRC